MTVEASDVPEDDVELFYLPVGALGFYDDPYSGVGDDGYDIETLKAEVIRDGGIQQPVAVGMSSADLDAKGDTSVCTFNGNHRLAVARETGAHEILCENSWANDAVPLTRARIEELGGRLVDEVQANPGP